VQWSPPSGRGCPSHSAWHLPVASALTTSPSPSLAAPKAALSSPKVKRDPRPFEPAVDHTVLRLAGLSRSSLAGGRRYPSRPIPSGPGPPARTLIPRASIPPGPIGRVLNRRCFFLVWGGWCRSVGGGGWGWEWGGCWGWGFLFFVFPNEASRLVSGECGQGGPCCRRMVQVQCGHPAKVTAARRR